MPFTIGSIHQNRRGIFVVVGINGKMASIRYQDGTEAKSEIEVLERIEENLSKERSFEDKQRLQFDEACQYLRREGIVCDLNDKFTVFRAANEHKESRRLVELHHEFLLRRMIPIEGRSLIAVAVDMQQAHRSTVCYSCRSKLDNFVHMECTACRWIMCPNCGACGCGYTR